jgi:hypothetical protein
VIIPSDGTFIEDYRFDVDRTTTVDSSLEQSHMDQFSTGIERQIWRDFAVQAQYVHRRYGGFIGYVDPRLDEWESYTAQDPGQDGRIGTGDDGGLLTGYKPYPGPRVLVLSNPPDAWRQYDALQLIARKRLSHGWQMEASYTASRSKGTVGNEANTNAAWASLSPGGIGADGRTRGTAFGRSVFDFSEAKAIATYDAPWLGGFRVGTVFRWRNGTRWHRLVNVRTPVFDFVPAEQPNSRRTPNVQSLDLRIEKTFAIPRAAGKLGVYVDVFNVANIGRARAFIRLSGPAF